MKINIFRNKFIRLQKKIIFVLSIKNQKHEIRFFGCN